LAIGLLLLPTEWEDFFYYLCLIAVCGVVLYWLVFLLRVSPVESIERLSTEDEALSVQTDPARYVDTRGHGALLLAFIRRSDGGVLGLTGVRGAGKSALIAHLLSQLRKQHFVLSMTAPVRHDPGLGFLSTVCRVVCRRVLDDIHQALYGKTTEEGRARLEILRRARNLGVATALLLFASLALIELRTNEQETLDIIDEGLCPTLRHAEVMMADDLLRQVNSLVTEGERNKAGQSFRSFRYRILPNPNGAGFALVPEMPGTSISFQPSGEASTLYAEAISKWITNSSSRLDLRLLFHTVDDLSCKREPLT
jgi:hypothetical protein